MLKLFSVDDHIVEPPDVWTSRVPAKYRDVAPHVVEEDDGTEVWIYEDTRHTYLGLNAVAGKPVEEWAQEPRRFDDMIPGCYDPDARAKDFAAAGIVSSLTFPTLPRFGGALFPGFEDKDLADVCVRAWNDFMFDWCSAAPELYVPMSIVQLWDVDAAQRELRRCLDRGIRAVSMPEETSLLGLPSYYSGFFDPLFAMCQEAGIPVAMHVASSGWRPFRPPESSAALDIALAFVPTITHAVGMMFSPVPRKFPDLKIIYSEGGIGWVPPTLERADKQFLLQQHWHGVDTSLLPSEICRRNMWFCMIDEPFGLSQRHILGVDKIFWECDYPHSVCAWPDTQEQVASLFEGVPVDEMEAITHKNAEKMFNWTCPDVVEAPLAAAR